MTRSAFALKAFLMLITIILPIKGFAINYAPYNGDEGYQEIRVARDVWFVAFHGDWNASREDVDAAWLTRVAQLCLTSGSAKFVELKYSFEPILKGDPDIISSDSEGVDLAIRKAFVIVIPVPVPSEGRTFYNAPSRQAHIRCISDRSMAQVIDSSRLLDSAKSLEEGKTRGWLSPDIK